MKKISTRELYVDTGEREKWIKVFKERGEVRNAELHLKRKDGRIITVLENARTVTDKKGNILYFEGTLTDVTKRERVQEQLKESEAKFRSFFDNVISGAYRTDPKGNILLANKSLVKMLGYKSKKGTDGC